MIAPTAQIESRMFLIRGHSERVGEGVWREKEKFALASLEKTLPVLNGPPTSDAWLGGK